ncbi:MAG: YheV family putative metal-binding protein [Pseudomonadales bacterium]
MVSSELPPRPARKRFVAGAVCPKCGQVDKTYVLGDGPDAVRGCNSCGFTERLGEAEAPADPAVVAIKLPE